MDILGESDGHGGGGWVFANHNGVFPNTDDPYQMLVVTTPEPGTVALLPLGIGLMLGISRLKPRRP